MSPARWISLAIATATLVTSSWAHSETPDSERRAAADDAVAIAVQTGSPTSPLGFVGIRVEHEWAGAARVSAGLGYNGSGPQLAVLGEILPARFLGLGLGVSRGAYHWEEEAGWECDEACVSRHWNSTTWIDAQLVVRTTVGQGWHLAGYIGASLNLEPSGADECTHGFFPAPCRTLDTDGGSRRTFAGVRVGRSF